jgi:hypothetical protein
MVRQANDQWKRQQQNMPLELLDDNDDNNDGVQDHSKKCNDDSAHLDETTSTVASSSSNGGEDDNNDQYSIVQSLQTNESKTIFGELSEWTNRSLFHNSFIVRNDEVRTPVSAASITDTTTTNAGYQSFPDDNNDNTFDLPIVDDGQVEMCYDNIDYEDVDRAGRNEKEPKHTSPATIIVERFRKSRLKARNAVFHNGNTSYGPSLMDNKEEEIVQKHDQTSIEVHLPTTSIVSSPLQIVEHHETTSPTTSILKQFAARRQQLSKMRKPKPPQSDESKYIPPSLESPMSSTEFDWTDTSTSEAENNVSFQVKDLISDVDELTNSFPHEAIDQSPEQTPSSDATGTKKNVVINTEQDVVYKNVAEIDNYNMNELVQKDRNKSSMTAVQEMLATNAVSPFSACMCTDMPFTPFTESAFDTDDSILKQNDTSNTRLTKKISDSHCRTITPESMSNQLTTTGYVKAIGETIVNTIDDDMITNKSTICSDDNGYNKDTRAIQNDKKSTFTSPTSINMEKSREPVFDNGHSYYGPSLIDYEEEDIVQKNFRTSIEVHLPTASTAATPLAEQQKSLPSTTSLLKKVAARRQQLSKLRKPKTSKSDDKKYIPPSLESPIPSTEIDLTNVIYEKNAVPAVKVENNVSFQVKDVMFDVGELTNSFPHEAIDQSPEQTSSGDAIGMKKNLVIDTEQDIVSKNMAKIDNCNTNELVQKDRNKSSMTATQGMLVTNVVSPMSACMCTDMPFTSFPESGFDMNDSIFLNHNDTSDAWPTKKISDSPCRTITPERLSKQLTATRYVKAIGETLVSTIDDDSLRNKSTMSTASTIDGISPVNVQSYIAQRHKSSRKPIPVNNLTLHQSHRSKNTKPIGLRTYAAIRDSTGFDFDPGAEEGAMEQGFMSNEGAEWETFDSTFETEIQPPQFLRVVHNDKQEIRNLPKDTSYPKSSNDSYFAVSNQRNSGWDDSNDCTDEDIGATTSTPSSYYNDGDESLSLKYVTEISFLPNTPPRHQS